ncbi:MAG: tetratricopeptide repeat protein, partial [Planctomycetota bacterium]
MQRDIISELDTEECLGQHFAVLKEMGDCCAAMSDFERARQCYRQASSLAPDAPAPYVGLGVIGIQCESFDDARAAFEIARKLDPDCAEAYSGLAMIHQQLKDHQSAFEMYLRCLVLDTDNLVALLGLFQTSIQMGSFSKIIHYLEVYLDRHPGDTSVLFCLATLYAREGELDAARKALLDVL